MEELNNKSAEQEETMTFSDVLKNLNKEIIAVTKYEENKELKSCSYKDGYITQEIFSCVTCFNDTSQMAGICKGCSLHCHRDHELLPLYFKRDFKCDCGNSQFSINL
jgi:E3 ubiquitin-protein ligase UBR7